MIGTPKQRAQNFKIMNSRLNFQEITAARRIPPDAILKSPQSAHLKHSYSSSKLGSKQIKDMIVMIPPSTTLGSIAKSSETASRIMSLLKQNYQKIQISLGNGRSHHLLISEKIISCIKLQLNTKGIKVVVVMILLLTT